LALDLAREDQQIDRRDLVEPFALHDDAAARWRIARICTLSACGAEPCG
jgi:hypothetical protein